MGSGYRAEKVWPRPWVRYDGSRISCCVSRSSMERSIQEVSTIEVVKFSGVISGGMVTSGTTCGTCSKSVLCKHCGKAGERTFVTNASLMSEVMIDDFPTPSTQKGIVSILYSELST